MPITYDHLHFPEGGAPFHVLFSCRGWHHFLVFSVHSTVIFLLKYHFLEMSYWIFLFYLPIIIYYRYLLSHCGFVCVYMCFSGWSLKLYKYLMIVFMLHKAIDLLGTEVMFVFTYHFISTHVWCLTWYWWSCLTMGLDLITSWAYYYWSFLYPVLRLLIINFWRFVSSFLLSFRFVEFIKIILFKLRFYCFKFLFMSNDLRWFLVDFLWMPA